jgi:hypothetical protein
MAGGQVDIGTRRATMFTAPPLLQGRARAVELGRTAPAGDARELAVSRGS